MAGFRQLAFALLVGVLSPCALAAEDESILISEVGRLNNQSLLWGPYRPNLYFGVRPRTPHGLMAGLMWGNVDNYGEIQQSLRWTCEQNEGMAGYGWEEYDTRRGGVQSIHDAGNNIDITTSFVKIPGGTHGGSWAVRVKGEPRSDAPPDLKTMVVFAVTQEGLGSTLQASEAGGSALGYAGDVVLEGNSQDLGDYRILITEGEGRRPTSDHEYNEYRDLAKTAVHSAVLPDEYLWQVKAVLFTLLKEGLDFITSKWDTQHPPPPWQLYLLGNKPGHGNMQMVQKVFEGPFEFDVAFSSASAGKDVTSEDLTREIRAATESFDERFAQLFEPKAPFAAGGEYRRFGKSMLSNLMGGIGYFYGHSVVDRSYAPEYDEENEGFWEETAAARARRQEQEEGPYELFSTVPSRPFFPRGFLWDEGFHLLPVADWDIDLTLEIVKSWFNVMDEDGWIAREQILGPEARTKVPAEFQVQYPHYANPPTLYLVLDSFVEKLRAASSSGAPPPAARETLSQDARLAQSHVENPGVGLEYLRRLYPLLRRQYDWFRRTQQGDIKSYDREAFSTKEAYRWRGRTVQHALTSGLDDYPRPQPPHPGELHVDLMAWMGMMTRSLAGMAELLGMPEEADELGRILTAIERNLDDLHWSDEAGCWCDATIDAFEEHHLVCHKGYISLFPFLVGMVKPDSPKLGRILDLIADPEELWSPFGIRSLSKKDLFYGTEENYWRSPVWINMNYLVISSLHSYATQDGPYKAKARDLYTRLRKNIVDAVFSSWEETGFAWEQYNPETGKGQRTQHFTGWTSLVVKIMAMDDLSGAGGAGGHVKDEL